MLRIVLIVLLTALMSACSSSPFYHKVFMRGQIVGVDGDQVVFCIGSLGESLEIDSFELLSLSAGVELGSGFQVSVFCRNCLDERYANFYANAVAQPGSKEAFVGNPREFGLTLRKRFGS